MFGRRELWQHEKTALIDALSLLESLPEAKRLAMPGTIGTLKAMLGIKELNVIPDYMNAAIASQVEKEGVCHD